MASIRPCWAKFAHWFGVILSGSLMLSLGLMHGCSEDCPTSPAAVQPPPASFTARPGHDGVALRWTNPGNDDFRGVFVRFSPDSLPDSPFAGEPVLNASGASNFEGEPASQGSLAHTGLDIGRRYYYSAFAYSDDYRISTAVVDSAVATDSLPPPPLIAFKAEESVEAVRLDWTAPQDPGYYGVMLRCSTAGYPDGPTAGLPVLEQGGGLIPGSAGATETLYHTGLTPRTTYYYAAFACDSSGNFSAARQDTAGLWHFLPRTSPQNLLLNLLGAYEHRNTARYESLLAQDFEFYFCEEDQSIAEKFTRDDEVEVHHHMFSHEDLQSIQLDFALGEVTEDLTAPDPIYPGRYLWTLTMTQADLELRLLDNGEPRVYRLEDGIEQFWFREEAWQDPHSDQPIWTIVRWREHSPEGPNDRRPVTWGQIKLLF